MKGSPLPFVNSHFKSKVKRPLVSAIFFEIIVSSLKGNVEISSSNLMDVEIDLFGYTYRLQWCHVIKKKTISWKKNGKLQLRDHNRTLFRYDVVKSSCEKSRLTHLCEVKVIFYCHTCSKGTAFWITWIWRFSQSLWTKKIIWKVEPF